ncbi:ABC-F family ATP-binding cassette domain-containing protein [Aliibacillus thermotolerans]|uniref:ABC-F family ATP-binding cassette domain-containing protein n=1 Tax=Aliibacillus thermotolerans TaxID=1834418 RepID=A0ABW0U702_9BACI|nr:ABC-F family ATP-binding cassette domain-containing protein [Aliibacillus thermotolerans]MDA3130454.1 ATP-binding cassette domain-containing protein [Aliibacillus thermotolerans]
MFILQCVNITKSFGVDTILQDVKLEIKEKERVALVGRNGAGKSTLLKIIAGELSADSGEVITPKEIKLGYLDQHAGLYSERSIWEEMLTVFDEVIQMEAELQALEEKMASFAVRNDPATYQKVLSEYDQLQASYQAKGGYQYETNIRIVLSGLQFDEFDYDTPVSTLSGGQKTRLSLGKMLLTQPDLLILDEPTNHLDIPTLNWLENYLINYDGALLLVSHDRYFLDKIVTKVYEISRTKATVYYGNYSDYLVEKAQRYEQQQKAFLKQQKEIASIEDFISRNIARASTSKRAQSRRKQLEKMTRMEQPIIDEKSTKFSFVIERESGQDVLTAKNVSVGYENIPVLENIDLQIKKQERIALIGPNGIGKSTLLKVFAGILSPSHGEIKRGSKVTIGYYDQEQRELHSNKDVLHELWDEYPLTPEKEIRTTLGNFLFSGEDVLKQVSDLSGGEKARLALAKLMMKKANFLIFDEPTNHLDLDSKEVLEAALLDYPGTLLFVSHDRYFLNRIATKIVELSRDGLKIYLGDYDYYLQKKEEEMEREKLATTTQPSSSHDETISSDKHAYLEEKALKREARKRQREIEKIEGEIETLEKEIETLEQEMFLPEVYEDYEKAKTYEETLSKLHDTLEQKMKKWEELQLEEA